MPEDDRAEDTRKPVMTESREKAIAAIREDVLGMHILWQQLMGKMDDATGKRTMDEYRQSKEGGSLHD